MDIGFHTVDFSWAKDEREYGPTLAKAAQIAEDSGISLLTFMDHYFQMEMLAPHTEPMLEGYTSLGFLAGVTKKINLGLLVTGVTYRNPGLLAKIVTTLDILSGGRAMLGIGAAWYEREHLGLGVNFPPVAERFSRLEETLEICLQMWSENDGQYQGKYFNLEETICHPRPISSPHPKILIGGSGEKKTLKLVAKYADACNLFGSSPQDVSHKLDVLKDHCKKQERDYGTIEKTMLYMGDPLVDPAKFLNDLGSFSEIGIDRVIVRFVGNPAIFAERFGDELSEKVLSI
ncbi:MAG: LLM class F420-dependent oxidoreductase [Acidimicrobiales bacterium]|nr:LLM class F420-dependent oxidoreductase [Acidimicrobiales bacterium]